MAADLIARSLAASAQPRPKPYTGLIATRINIPSLINASFKQMNFRRWHIARDSVTRLQIALPNWAANNAAGEIGTGGTAQFTAAIERLDGSIERFAWGGESQSPVVADGGQTPLTDTLTLTPPLKYGEWFAIRGYGVFSNAVPLCSLSTSAVAAAGDAVEYLASGLTDKSLGGTIGTNAAITFGPCLIVGETRRPSVALFGDSRVKGGSSSPGTDTADGSGDLGELARSIGPALAYMNMGSSSETLEGFLANGSRRLANAAFCSHVLCNYGINDLSTLNRTSTQVLASIAALAALPALNGKQVVWATITPRATSTDSWATLANQTAHAKEADRVAINEALRARRVAGLADVFDVSLAVESVINSGRFAIENGGQAITGDGLHLNALGNQRILRSAVIAAERLVR
jgi:lysophospholipase L1-like esterase